MTLTERVPPFPLITGLLSIISFALSVWAMNTRGNILEIAAVAALAFPLALTALIAGFGTVRKRPHGARYGFAMSGFITGIMAVVFWIVMVPMLLFFTLPARQAEPEDPLLTQSKQQMRILVRHIKTFEQMYGRLPVRIDELLDRGLIQEHLLYDPRQARRDAPSYRLLVRELPQGEDESRVPILEGRIPNPRDGTRLVAFADETVGTIPN